MGRIEKMKKDNEMKFDMIDQSLSVEIVKAVKKAVKQAMARGKKASNLNNSYEDLAQGKSLTNSPSAAQISGDIGYLMSLKANNEDLHNLESIKANKVDTEQLLVS